MSTWVEAIVRESRVPSVSTKVIVPSGVNVKAVSALLNAGKLHTTVPKKIKNKVYHDLVDAELDLEQNDAPTVYEPPSDWKMESASDHGRNPVLSYMYSQSLRTPIQTEKPKQRARARVAGKGARLLSELDDIQTQQRKMEFEIERTNRRRKGILSD